MYYYSLIKCVLSVRNSTPNKLVVIESGLYPLECLVYSRQLNFIKRFRNLDATSVRKTVFEHISNTKYIKHYMDDLTQK